MQSFKDSEGRDWIVTVTVATVKRVRQMCDVNLLELLEGQLLQRLAADPVLLCDVLYAVCQPQASERNLTDEQFGAAMGGEVIDKACAAFLEALTDFFPNTQQRENLKLLLTKIQRAREQQYGLMRTKLESLDLDTLTNRLGERIDALDLDAIAERLLENASDSSGIVPGSSGSILGPSPSEN